MKSYKSLSLSLAEKKKKKEFIIVAGVDEFTHLKCCQESGCDLVLLYPTAKYQNAQNRFLSGYLAFGNTNDMMMDTLSEFIPLINKSNVLAGINGSDPFKMDHILINRLIENRIFGIHNYPSMSLIDGNFGMNIDSLNQGIQKEMEFFKKAKQQGLFTCAMVQSKKDALSMARISVDMIIFYLGLGEQRPLKENLPYPDFKKLESMVQGVRSINPDLPLLFFDERITSVDEIKKITDKIPELNGYCLLPLLRKNLQVRQLELEIKQLRQ